MPLPNDSVTVTGGCSCGAIRYRIAVPRLEDRPLQPMSPPAQELRLPYTLTCHCNDCRRATGSFLAVGVTEIPSPMLTVSAIPLSSESTIVSGRILDVQSDNYSAQKADADRGDCGPDRSRSFCGRCGSQLCYHFELKAEYCYGGKMPGGWQDAFRIYLGSLDREFLETDWFAPAAESHFKYGTPLSRCVSATAKGLKGVYKMQVFDEAVTEEELAQLRAR
ncbi:hypothetical protein FZEAL_7251 [Fusarium zealandicum]|uniref:CENP-V/GFA domain-containing protein n=1 Tax=Fusarium zealandicum TaxID=1053134 RepID=A0A8H4XI18_9HYPO|nr:hypothetical protein FZEAL_7251 [Fusarium zealandicum]